MIFDVRPKVDTQMTRSCAEGLRQVLNFYEEEIRSAYLDCILYGTGEAMLRLEEKIKAKLDG